MMTTVCLSSVGVGNWVSVSVPPGAAIGYVMVRNRADAYASLLGRYEVWLGESDGDEQYKCGGTKSGDDGDVASWCAAQSSYTHVTVKQVGASRYLSIAEIEVYDSS